MLPIHTSAPAFELLDQDNKMHQLSDYLGKWVVLYFYPKDDTPGCTKEACNFRDSYQEFIKRGMVILGVSQDSVASHLKFASKYHLTFPLLSDPDKNMIKAYEAGGLISKRITYLINPQGLIAKSYDKVNPLTHAKQILDSYAQ